METEGWIMMTLSWGVIIALLAYCLVKLFKKES
jgi:hypothetical protein